MAGAGYKLFNTGDVLTAAQVNTYLMQQTVMVFASSAARTSALSGVLAEGMVSYLQDTNTLEVYDGSSWVGATGDITGLTAGTGISISSATGPVPTVTNSMATEITAKGDLIVGTGSGTFDNLAAGSSGDTLVADSSTPTGLRWQPNFRAGNNAVINGDFRIWQRGTSFSNPNGVYTADRFLVNASTAVPTWTVSQQSFTAGTAPVAGYEGTFFLRAAVTSQGSSTSQLIQQRIEDVRTFANQTVTFSFWAKAASTISISAVKFGQNFGSGGSGATETSFTMNSSSVGTSWARYTGTITVPSVSGKTIGTSSYGYLFIEIASSQGNYTFDTWGWQLEPGSVASAFETATGTLQGELAACQRYYNRYTPGTQAYGVLCSSGVGWSTTLIRATFAFPVEMRTNPSSVEYSTIRFVDSGSTTGTISAANLLSSEQSPKVAFVEFTSTGVTQHRPSFIEANNSTSGYVGFSAEL
jgi:hypothetical protein